MDWYDQDSVKLDEMSKIEQSLLGEMREKAKELRADAKQDAYLNGALILLVLGVSLVGAFVVARSMVRSLRRLQDTAQDVAQKRLPELVKQLSDADPQDVDTSVESVGVHSRDEIGKVAAAFDDVHREAVRLAAEQALLRGNVNAMFTNLSRRSQGLIQRQLSLISELESREADPDQLSSLFKLDHLATRMRRNGENLLVLAGEEPGRRWTRPVPLVDVLRAAASEVEQYERIELSSVPTTEVAGRVVNDLVHLLAELLENATSFSSPQTKVKVTGHALPDGRVLIEIHDTGIGLSPEDLAAINERLASPPTVDVSVSRRMGLFVVGRLSLRHGIRIQLRPPTPAVPRRSSCCRWMSPRADASPPRRARQVRLPAAEGGDSGNGAANLLGSSSSRRQVPGSGPRTALAGGSGLPTRPVGAGAGAGQSSGSAPRVPTSSRAAAAARSPSGTRPAARRPRPPLPHAGTARPSRRRPAPRSAPTPPAPRWRRPSAASDRGAAPELPGPQQPAARGPAVRSSPVRSRGRAGARGVPAPTTGRPGRPRVTRWTLRAATRRSTPRRRCSTGTRRSAGRPRARRHGRVHPPAVRPGRSQRHGPVHPAAARPEQARRHGPVHAAPTRPGRTRRHRRIPRPQFNQSGPSDTGQFTRPQLGQGGPGDTGEFPDPSSTRADPATPASSPGPNSARADPATPANSPTPVQPGRTQRHRPVRAAPTRPGRTRWVSAAGRARVGPDSGSGTGEFPMPQQPQPPQQSQQRQPQQPAHPQQSQLPQQPQEAATAVGPSRCRPPGRATAGRRSSTRSSPTGSALRRRAEPAPDPYLGGGPGAVPPQPRRDAAEQPRTPDGLDANSTTGTTDINGISRNGAASNWRTSPNDEHWRRAEQIREPAAGGITSSGLPRRVPARTSWRARRSSSPNRQVRRCRARPTRCVGG
ncbi:ATP-binding protein [Streptomyces sp. M19]